MQLFYNPSVDSMAKQVVFGPEESRHITKVLRKREGDTVTITNGKGDLFKAKLLIASVKKCQAEIFDTTKTAPPKQYLHMAVAPTKLNDRFEWFLEKATEIGVSEITPIICERSERKAVKLERFEKVLQAAMKQSLQTYLPKLNEAISLKKFLAVERSGLLFIAHCEENERYALQSKLAKDANITILIGPEGDFSSSEITLSLDKGFLPVSLGEHRLRTETAAIVACTTVAVVNNL